MALFLSLEDFTVCATDTAEAGLELLQHTPVDFVVTDFNLPGRNGGWLIDSAVEAGLLPATRALIITADATDAGSQTAVPILRKPLELDALVDAVRRALSDAASGDR